MAEPAAESCARADRFCYEPYLKLFTNSLASGLPVSLFAFLKSEWPELFEPAAKAESLVYPDSRSSCFHARRALELAVHWLYKHDSALKLPYQDHLSALIHAPSFRSAVGPAIFAKIKVIKDLGNLAVHSHKPVRQFDALTATKELFPLHVLAGAHLCAWGEAGGQSFVQPGFAS